MASATSAAELRILGQLVVFNTTMAMLRAVRFC